MEVSPVQTSNLSCAEPNRIKESTSLASDFDVGLNCAVPKQEDFRTYLPINIIYDSNMDVKIIYAFGSTHEKQGLNQASLSLGSSRQRLML